MWSESNVQTLLRICGVFKCHFLARTKATQQSASAAVSSLVLAWCFYLNWWGCAVLWASQLNLNTGWSLNSLSLCLSWIILHWSHWGNVFIHLWLTFLRLQSHFTLILKVPPRIPRLFQWSRLKNISDPVQENSIFNIIFKTKLFQILFSSILQVYFLSGLLEESEDSSGLDKALSNDFLKGLCVFIFLIICSLALWLKCSVIHQRHKLGPSHWNDTTHYNYSSNSYNKLQRAAAAAPSTRKTCSCYVSHKHLDLVTCCLFPVITDKSIIKQTVRKNNSKHKNPFQWGPDCFTTDMRSYLMNLRISPTLNHQQNSSLCETIHSFYPVAVTWK